MFNSETFFRSRYGILLSAIFTMALWGCMLPLIKVGYEIWQIESSNNFGQLAFAGFRFTLAGLMILAYMRFLREPIAYRPGSGSHVLKLAIVFIFLQNACLNIGISTSTGIFASLLTGLVSINQMIIAHYVFAQDKMYGKKWIGILFGFTGLALLTLQSGDGNINLQLGQGELLLFGSTWFAAWGNIMAKNATKLHPVNYLNGYLLLLGGVMLLVTSGIGGGWSTIDFNPLGMLLMLFMSLTSAVTFIIWNNLLKYNDVGKISMFLFLVPIFGVIQSSIYLGEAISSFAFLSMVLVSVGILIVNRQRGKSA